ncbi:MAG: DHH family phosphoesterase [Oscillospiraceae bacterium]|nr:DHH family phosphoesterase [Oscillospiraceae bacterium]
MEQDMQSCRMLDRRAAYEVLRSLEDVYILIHRSPDGDCIGGGYALHHILRSFGCRSKVVCADPIPPLYSVITDGISFEDFAPKTYLSIDVADRKLFGELPPEQKNGEVVLCIDHHGTNTQYAKNLLLEPQASAACEVLYYVMKENGIPLTQALALCLYIGIATDTGCFQFSNAGADAFAAVSEIKRAFPELPYARLNRELFVLKSPGRIRLDARLMQDIRLSESGKTALIYLPYELMTHYSLSSEEVDSVANLPMQMIGVEIGITCKQQADGTYRVSMRGGDHADVSKVAAQFGGGGHIKASGCSVKHGTPEEVCAALMTAAEASLQ